MRRFYFPPEMADPDDMHWVRIRVGELVEVLADWAESQGPSIDPQRLIDAAWASAKIKATHLRLSRETTFEKALGIGADGQANKKLYRGNPKERDPITAEDMLKIARGLRSLGFIGKKEYETFEANSSTWWAFLDAVYERIAGEPHPYSGNRGRPTNAQAVAATTSENTAQAQTGEASDGARPLETQEPSRARLYGVPPRNPAFIGRDGELDQLHKTLVADQRPTAVSQAAVHGLGGIGKTSVAAEYAHRYASAYTGAWWAAAESKTVLITSLLELGSVLGLPLTPGRSSEALVRDVLHRLAEAKKPWLLMYDNVSSPREVDGLLPSGDVHVIITTRWHDWADTAVELELAVWGQDTAVEFLVRRAKRGGDRGDAARLAEALGYLPLALDHAGASIERTGTTFKSYLARINTLIRKAPKDSRYPNSVYATFNIAIDNATKDSTDARHLMAALALLAPERIPHTLIEKFVSDPSNREDALEALSIVSLIKHDVFSDEAPAVIIHRMVQAATIARLEQDAHLPAVMAEVIRALNAVFPDDVFRKIQLWPTCEKLLPHALFILQARSWPSEDVEQLTNLAYNVARYLHGRSDLRRAKALYFTAICNGRKFLGCQHPNVIRTIAALSNLARDAGRLKQAEPLARAVVALREQISGADSPAVADALNLLASVLRDGGRLQEAETLLGRAIAIMRKARGPDALEVATLLNGQANLLVRLARVEEAEQIFMQAIKIGRERLGEKHSDVATWEHNLVMLLVDKGQYTEAETMLQSALPVLRKELGMAHPNVLRCRVTYAKVFLATGRPDNGYVEAVEALAAYRLALTHPWVTDAAKTLISICRVLGRDDEADTYAQKYGLR